jgi:phosphatidylserine/phosphatidylglycerophosphate/cardiolipin synthase-like enzyme
VKRFISLCALASLASCNPAPSAEDVDGTRGSRIDVYFNDPGSRLDQIWHPDVVELMIDMIDQSQATIRFAVMGFTYEPLIEAFVRAHDRGVKIEMVGDAGHLYNWGYQRFDQRQIPYVTGNLAHIMHNKFMVIDDRFTVASTANWSPTDLKHNSNNFVVIDSPAVAADFTAEHQQMWNGLYGHNKLELDNGRFYQVGDTLVEVWFAPNEDVSGRMLELVNGAEESVWFTIFAFTKDQVGGAYIAKQEELASKGLLDDASPTNRKGVWGVIDQSQLHSNGQYHEAYRLLAAGIPMRMDGNDASKQPGDYQAGGGRLHSKTMVIDADGENPVVISGSFNWSASATQSNDEYLLIFHGKRVAQDFKNYFEYLWENGRELGAARVEEGGLQPGDITFSEVHWYGAHAFDIDGYDEFIELRNHTPNDIPLDMWQITGVDDFKVGIPPGSILPANGTFTIVDHLLETYQDGAPQDAYTAFTDGDLILNSYNDNRQARLYIHDGALELALQDPAGVVVDRVGDGGPAFHGGPVGEVTYEGTDLNGDPITASAIQVRSMIRLDPEGDGADPSSWGPSTVNEGGSWVNDDPNVQFDYPNPIFVPYYKDNILATPGELDPAQPQ